MARTGRPRLPAGEVKTAFLTKIRVSEDEKRIFEQKARESGQSFSDWAREVLRNACK